MEGGERRGRERKEGGKRMGEREGGRDEQRIDGAHTLMNVVICCHTHVHVQ